MLITLPKRIKKVVKLMHLWGNQKEFGIFVVRVFVLVKWWWIFSLHCEVISNNLS